MTQKNLWAWGLQTNRPPPGIKSRIYIGYDQGQWNLDTGTAWETANLNTRGAYNASTTYQKKDLVLYDGEQWLALDIVTGVTPVEGASWTKFLSKGAAGPVGLFAAIRVVGPQTLQGTLDAALTQAGVTDEAYMPGASEVNLTCNVTTAGAGELRAQYSTDSGSTWNYLSAVGTGPLVSVSTTGLKDSGWVEIASGAKAAVRLRLVSINGTGATVALDEVVVRVRGGGTVSTTDHNLLTNRSVADQHPASAITYGAGNVGATLDSLAAVPAIATQSQADAGTNDTTIMTPLKVASRPQKNTVFEGYIEGLNPAVVAPGTNHNNVSVTSGACWIPGSAKIVNNPSTITPPSSTTLSINTWYYIYGYESGGVLALDPLSTVAPTAPYKGTARTKTSDNTRRYLGAVKTSASAVMFRTSRRGSWVYYNEPTGTASPWNVVAGGLATTATTIDCSPVVPLTSTAAQFAIYNTGTTVVAFCNTNIATVSSTNNFQQVSANVYSAAPLLLNTSQALQYLYTAAVSGAGLYLTVNGYIEDR